jgi:putative membrane protein
MKLLTAIAGLLGLALTAILLVHQGLGEILQVLSQAGWALLWIVPFHLLPLLLDAAGWRLLLAPRDTDRRAGLPFLLWVAAVREAVNRLLPVANIGGELIGIRLVVRRGVNGAVVTASVIVEVLLTMIVQYLFTALGLVLILSSRAAPMAWTIFTGLALSLPVPILLGALLKYGSVFERMERAVERMLGDGAVLDALSGGSGLDIEIRALYERNAALLGALAWQLAGYVLGSFEVWLALRLLGHPIGIGAAIALEALTQALRHFIFFVPGGLGVQEAGLVLFGQMIGIGNDVALSLSLAKRMRELLFCLPPLLVWQWQEGRRLTSSLSQRQTG